MSSSGLTDMRVGRLTATAVASLVGCLTAACASGRTGAMSTANPRLISVSEIEQAREDGVRDLYELIEQIRPRWLQGRNPRSLQLQTVIAVYHNETLLGGLDALRGHLLVSVTSVRYLDAAQAMLLPGAGSTHIEGAIVISTALVRDTVPGPAPARFLRGGV